MNFSKRILLILLFVFVIGYTYGRKQDVTNGGNTLDQLRRGEYIFKVGQTVKAYNPEESKEISYAVHVIDDCNGCLGITTDASETVLLQCPGQKSASPECFEVLSSKSKCATASKKEKTTSCLYTGPAGIGIITPLDWMIILVSDPSPISPNFAINVGYNGPPRRM